MKKKLLFRIVVVLGLVGFIFYKYIDLVTLLEIFTNLNKNYFSSSAICILIMILLKAKRLHKSLPNGLDFIQILRIYTTSNLAIIGTPLRLGEVARPILLKRRGIPIMVTTTNLIFERISDALLILTLLIGVLMSQSIMIPVVVFFLYTCCIFLLRKFRIVIDVQNYRFLKSLKSFVPVSGSLDFRGAVMGSTVFYITISAAAQFFSVLSIYFLFLTFDQYMSVDGAILTSSLSSLSTLINITPGGIGIRELLLLNTDLINYTSDEIIFSVSILDSIILPIIILFSIYLCCVLLEYKKC